MCCTMQPLVPHTEMAPTSVIMLRCWPMVVNTLGHPCWDDFIWLKGGCISLGSYIPSDMGSGMGAHIPRDMRPRGSILLGRGHFTATPGPVYTSMASELSKMLGTTRQATSIFHFFIRLLTCQVYKAHFSGSTDSIPLKNWAPPMYEHQNIYLSWARTLLHWCVSLLLILFNENSGRDGSDHAHIL